MTTDEPSSDTATSEVAPTTSRVAVAVSHLRASYRVQRSRILLIALTIAAVGLAVGVYVLQYRPDRRIDDAAVMDAVRAASDGAVALLSYSSDTLDRDFAAARSHLTGEFLTYYNTFTQQVVAPAVRDKHLVQSTAVIRAAASQFGPTSAVVLAFVNETVTSANKNDPSVTPSAVRVTLQKVGGRWLISKLDPVA